MIIHILAGGPVEYCADFSKYKSEEVVWAAVDRGVYHLLQRGIIPSVAFGDYDSVTAEELAWMQKQTSELHIVPREKDQTDLEIAINWALEQKPKLVRIFGATGGRLDHGLANIQMLLKGLHAHTEMHIVDNQNEIAVKKVGTYIIEANNQFPYVSFVPVTEIVKGITLHGFKYPLTDKTIEWGSTLCISNELVAEKGTFSFTSGILMVIRSAD
ncbi:thiamine diphosphokinase [Bacillus sp. DX1.1]|uniref:thiamine diphosphokinase n=1 Tax=unclassified Bacillus (in: firmicutes) TaxID=185979 RepID=UPI00256FCCA0|nr:MULTISPECIES: thiamine diphosphokinase [unclassified Bacillus (in: firmicutes)]MDM5156047.1 thiamine diphosphokinase [Bacillus sp. DX1.1]WJE80336.1 thiamine diphosphokinase [Bacillus sp. DX3.1]